MSRMLSGIALGISEARQGSVCVCEVCVRVCSIAGRVWCESLLQAIAAPVYIAEAECGVYGRIRTAVCLCSCRIRLGVCNEVLVKAAEPVAARSLPLSSGAYMPPSMASTLP